MATQPIWLDGYSGQSVDELLAMEATHRIDSLVLAFEQAIGMKGAREGDAALNDAERVVLAIEGLEREVNNGGYAQFFINSSREFAPVVVEALRRIGCPRTAEITERATAAIGRGPLSVEEIDRVMAADDPERDAQLDACSDDYFRGTEDIAGRLFEFIKANRARVRV